MTFPVAQTIKEFGAKRLAAVTNLPLRTIYRWGELNKVSGTGVVHDMRLNLLKAAVDKLKGQQAAPPKSKPKKRARAA